MDTYQKTTFESAWDWYPWAPCTKRVVASPQQSAQSPALPMLNSETRAPTVLGDHVHALPYWNELTNVVIPPSVGTLKRAVYGTGFDTSFDFPPCMPGYKNSQTVHTITSELSHQVPWAQPDLPSLSEADLSFLRKAAETKALAAARGAMVNLPMILKERRETLGIVGKKVASIAGAARDLQAMSLKEYLKASKPRKRDVAQKAAEQHLEFVFGILPVLDEVNGACEFISQPAEIKHIKVRGTHGVVQNAPVVSQYPVNHPFANDLGSVVRHGSVTTNVSVRCALRYDITSGIQSARDLGFDPIGFAFDAVPLSFVSGWVSNFDKWVRALSPLVGLQFVTGSMTTRRTTSEEGVVYWAHPRPSAQYPLITASSSSEKYLLERKRWDREIVLVEPETTFQFQNNLSLYSVTAGISLMVQRYNKPLARMLTDKRFWTKQRHTYTE